VNLGLAFIGGEGPPPAVCSILAKQAEIIIAADSGLLNTENAGITPDWIIGDMDSVDVSLLKKYPAEKILRFPSDKDFTDTELALNLLWKKNCDAIWIAGGGGGRLDHLLAIRSLFEREKFPQRWITNTDDIYCLDASGRFSGINIDLPVNSIVSVFPLGAGEWKIESRGLKWPLNNVAWNSGSAEISNRNTEKNFSIQTIHGRFMIVLPLIIQEE